MKLPSGETSGLLAGSLNDVPRLIWWKGGRAWDLSTASSQEVSSIDALLSQSKADIQRSLNTVSASAIEVDLQSGTFKWEAPAGNQEVWGAGVTYLRSRSARVEESHTHEIYLKAYEARRPELFYKAAGWQVVPHQGSVAVRPDSEWNVPEPELAVVSNCYGEVIGYACGNDMTSRSIEGENPLYLPQAKIFLDSCSIGPWIVPSWEADPREAPVTMVVERDGSTIVSGTASVRDLIREPADLTRVLHAYNRFPVGAWLLTGAALVPDKAFTALPDDKISISIGGLGELVNHVYSLPRRDAEAIPTRIGT